MMQIEEAHCQDCIEYLVVLDSSADACQYCELPCSSESQDLTPAFELFPNMAPSTGLVD